MAQIASKQTGSLQNKFQNLLDTADANKCNICMAFSKMDDDTRVSFFDVMKSSVTTVQIVSVMNEEGFEVTKWMVGAARRECIRGSKRCPTFTDKKQK